MSLQNVYDENGERLRKVYYDTKAKGFRGVEYIEKNCIINRYTDGKWEIVYYRQPFKIPKHIALDAQMINDEQTYFDFVSTMELERQRGHDVLDYDRISQHKTLNDYYIGGDNFGRRNFQRIGDIAVPLREGVTLSDFEKTIVRGGRRAMDNFYNYALSNEWEYFCTWTFAEKSVRLSLELISEMWLNFLETIKRRNPNVRVLAVPEAFNNEEEVDEEDGDYYFPNMQGFHLHSLMGNCDLRLIPKRFHPRAGARPSSRYKEGDFMYTPFGAARMQSIDWKKGFNEVVMINPASAQLQVVNYLTKYLTKGFNLPFGCRRFYKTRNLKCRFNYVRSLDESGLERCVNSLGLIKYEKPGREQGEENVLVYRNF